MTLPFVKFPRTPHLPGSTGATDQNERVLPADQVERLFSEPVVVEEKVDGANIGISFDDRGELVLQNRGTILGTGRDHPQFHPLFGWALIRREKLWEKLGERLILFGEWLFARHTVAYEALPDYLLAHDLYDRATGRFLDIRARSEVSREVGVHEVPRLFSGILGSPEELKKLLAGSRVGNEPAEGVYVRLEKDGHLEIRAKLVRAGWMPDEEVHWSQRPLEKNALLGGRLV